MLDGRQFDLEFGFWRIRVFRKDLENEIDPIPGLHFRFRLPERFVDRVNLRGLEDVSYDKEICLKFGSERDNLVELSASYVGMVVGRIAFLDFFHYGHSSVRRDERSEFGHTNLEFFLGNFVRSDVEYDGFQAHLCSVR